MLRIKNCTPRWCTKIHWARIWYFYSRLSFQPSFFQLFIGLTSWKSILMPSWTRLRFPCFFWPFRPVEFFQSELQWEHGDNLGVSHTCFFLGHFGTWYAHQTIDDLPVSDASKNVLLQPLYLAQAKPRLTADEEQFVLSVLRIVSNFHMMSRAICASLLLVMLACAAHMDCSNDCTNESNALLQIHGSKIKEDTHEKKRWRRRRRRWRRRYYSAHTPPRHHQHHQPPPPPHPPAPAPPPAPAHPPAPAPPPALAFA